VKDFADLGTLVPKESYHCLGPSPMRLNDLCTRPDNGVPRSPPPLSCFAAVRGIYVFDTVERRGAGGGAFNDPR